MLKDKQLDKFGEALVESFIKEGAKENLFSNPSIQRTTAQVLENQIADFTKRTEISAERITKVLAPVDENGKPITEGESSYSSQGTDVAAGDIARFGEIYLPIATKVIPSLVINNMVGVQPMSQPNGYVYGQRSCYGTGPYDHNANRQGAKFETTQIIVVEASVTTAVNTASAGALWARSDSIWLSQETSTADGLILHIEGNTYLVKLEDSANPFDATNNVDVFTSAGNAFSASEGAVTAQFPNEVGQAAGLLKTYSSAGTIKTVNGVNIGEPVSTDDGMYQRNVGQANIKIVRASVDAQTRQMFAEYPVEAEQDMKAIHGRDLRSELSELTAGIIVNEINKEFIDEMEAAATYAANTDSMAFATIEGRWENEKFRSIWTRLVKLGQDIALDTRLGPGNFIIGTSEMISMLMQLDGFTAAPVPAPGSFSAISKIGGEWYVGHIGGMFDLYRDMFASGNYAIIGRKGQMEWDAGVFFLPYIPLQFASGVTQENLQPKLKFSSRYGKVGSPIAPSASDVSDTRYYRKLTITGAWETS